MNRITSFMCTVRQGRTCILAFAVVVLCSTASHGLQAQSGGADPFERAARLYDQLLRTARINSVYDDAQSRRPWIKEGQDSLEAIRASIGDVGATRRLGANLAALRTWLDTPLIPDQELHSLLDGTAEPSVLSRRLARRVQESLALPQLRLALQTHNHLRLLSLYGDFLAARTEWEISRVNERSDSLQAARSDSILRMLSILAARRGKIIVIDGAARVAPDFSLGALWYSSRVAGVGVLIRGSGWVAELESAAGSGSIATGAAVGRDFDSASALVGVLLQRTTALEGAVTATLIVPLQPRIESAITLSHRGEVGVKLFWRP